MELELPSSDTRLTSTIIMEMAGNNLRQYPCFNDIINPLLSLLLAGTLIVKQRNLVDM